MWVRATDGELVNLGHAHRVRIDRLRADHCDVVAWFGVELGNTIKIAEGVSETAASALMTALQTQVLGAVEVTEAGEILQDPARSDREAVDGVTRAAQR